MGRKRNGGFSLVETLISIVILGAMVVPTCTALVMSIKLNDKTEQMLQAQLAVSSAVETLMAEGYSADKADNFDGVTITTDPDGDTQDGVYYALIVSCDDVVVKTTIRAADPVPQGGGS